MRKVKFFKWRVKDMFIWLFFMIIYSMPVVYTVLVNSECSFWWNYFLVQNKHFSEFSALIKKRRLRIVVTAGESEHYDEWWSLKHHRPWSYLAHLNGHIKMMTQIRTTSILYMSSTNTLVWVQMPSSEGICQIIIKMFFFSSQ